MGGGGAKGCRREATPSREVLRHAAAGLVSWDRRRLFPRTNRPGFRYRRSVPAPPFRRRAALRALAAIAAASALPACAAHETIAPVPAPFLTAAERRAL